MSKERRYLPIMEPDGSWTESPDLLILARMSYPDQSDDRSVSQLYDTMCRQDSSQPLTTFEESVEEQLRKHSTDRKRAASVVGASIQLLANTNSYHPLSAAYRLAAYDFNRSKKVSSPKNLTRRFSNGYSLFRSTAHLQAAMMTDPDTFGAIERDPEALRRFLSTARAIEEFLDRHSREFNTKWNPWRVPVWIKSDFPFETLRLTEEQLRVALLP